MFRAPTYPPETGPTQKNIIVFLRIFFFLFFFFIILLTNPAVFWLKKLLQRLLLYAFLPYLQHL